MKVLMFGWEFPPFFAGGVGMVCYEMTKEMCRRGDVDLTYVMPSGPEDTSNSHVKILVANNMVSDNKIKVRKIDSPIGAYMTADEYDIQMEKINGTKAGEKVNKDNTKSLYGKNLLQEVFRFAEKSRLIAREENFDIIHSHDWTTFPAGVAAKEETGKPFIAHVHITEFDKSGGTGADPEIYAIEKGGMDAADKIIAVSQFVKDNLIKNYFQPADKIEVVHNGANEMNASVDYTAPIQKEHKIVLFAGRVTLQKGPEYFVEAAQKVIPHYDKVRFVMAGSGDMLPRMIDKAADAGIAEHFIFHGFYSRDEAEKLFSMADLFVMPSVSEPFGIVPFEAMAKGTPAIISNQSGCSEVTDNALKADFWDTDEMANQIINVLKYPELQGELTDNGFREIEQMSWEEPVNKYMNVYHSLK